MAKALDDLRVLELAQGWAGPLCGRLLADLGAEVIKIEPPGGDFLRTQPPLKNGRISYAFQLTSANKKSVTLDLETPSDLQTFKELAETADILIEDTPTGVMEKLGLAYRDLQALNPSLIYCSLTPFGRTGPLSSKPASEMIVQALGGHMALTGQPGSPPIKAGPPMAAHMGATYAAIAILAALNYRDRTGRGQFADISQQDILVLLINTFLPKCFVTGKAEPRIGNRHPLMTPWNSYMCKDGWAIICATEERMFNQFLKIIGREELIGAPGYDTVANRRSKQDELDAMITNWTRTKTVKEVVETCDQSRIPAGPILTIEQLLHDPHFLGRSMVAEVEDKTGEKVTTIGSPFGYMAETPGRVERAAPALGEHNREVLSTLAEKKAAKRKERVQVTAVRGGSSEPAKALEGVKVVEVGKYTTGPLAGRILATLGAEVIKVESPEGDLVRQIQPKHGDMGYLFHLNNSDKKATAIDLTKEEGKETYKKLAATADAFIDSMAAGSSDRMGLGYSTIKEANPDIIYCAVNGFGQFGSYRNKLGLDTTLQAMAGILEITGRPEDPPTKIGASIVDLMGGSFAPLAIMVALHYHHRTGKGQFIDLSMHDLAGWLSQALWPHYLATRQNPPRLGNRDLYRAPHNTYQAEDGLVAIAVDNETQWQKLLDAMGRKDLLKDSRYDSMEKRIARVNEVDEIVSQWVKGKKVQDIVAACDKAGVPACHLPDVHEVIADPQVLHHQMIVDIDDGQGDRVKVSGSPFKMSETPGRVEKRAPWLGEHNEEVLRELGYSKEQIARLKEEGVLAQQTPAK